MIILSQGFSALTLLILGTSRPLLWGTVLLVVGCSAACWVSITSIPDL